MTTSSFSRKLSSLAKSVALCSLFLQPLAHATTVQFQTSLGDFEVVLFDEATPLTVANFLNYVNADNYDGTIFHRSVPGFILQGGGFTFVEEGPPEEAASIPAVLNEPEYSNVTGTIAMAKVGGNPNSATNQWFFNLADNSENLDIQNGGFTVFGQVSAGGMEIIEAMAALPTFNMGYVFDNIPLIDYTEEEFVGYYGDNDTVNYGPVDASNGVFVFDIAITDAAVDSAAELTPAENVLIDTYVPPVNNPVGPAGDADGGGNLGFFGLLAIGLLGWARRTRKPV